MKRDSILIATHPRSGARYLSALIGSSFEEYVHFSPVQVTSLDELPTYDRFIKTHGLNLNTFDKIKTKLYVVKNPYDVVADCVIDDGATIENSIKYNVPLWKEHVGSWLNNPEAHVIWFSSLMFKEHVVVEWLSNLLDVPIKKNDTRTSELRNSQRMIGRHLDLLNDSQRSDIETQVSNTIKSIRKRIEY